ncbi:MAG: DUF4127 family protein [Peptococcaceae bacterium]
MKRFFLIFILMAVLILGACVFSTRGPEKVGLIPLDSRPCNTLYPQLLGNMLNKDIVIPFESLDNYLTPGDTANLWQWLENNAGNLDTIIIFTNEIFNGGLIASRHESSYQNLEQDLTGLKAFCLNNKSKNIIVVSILPRLLPSQFSELWEYEKELVNYAKAIDRQAKQGKETPPPPSDIPADILKKYLSIYDNTDILVKSVIAMSDEGLVDHYLIGQDDAQEYGLSNKIVREITPLLNEKVQFVHGADELTMLTLVRSAAPKLKDGINVKYINEALKTEYFPYEAATLETVLKAKLDYLQVHLAAASPYVEIVYNDSNKLAGLKDFLRQNNHEYLGLMDVAFTNKGDTGILDMLSDNPGIKLDHINGYAGWNTAGNTIGTELAHLVAYNYLEKNIKKYKQPDKIKALESFIKFKYLRIAEDLIYQGILRDKLIERLREEKIDPYFLGEHKEYAEHILADLYQPYEAQLNNLFAGNHHIGEITFTVDKVQSRIELPWSRTFEARIIPEVTVLWGEE